ncbi:Y-family DNA polymerase [Piscinibacter sakaiensis]|uniref:Y-family DNA polymerase n=1 Tax=Piscinibacter sakaiensis TaxID=1547922 RepID=UPI003AAC2BEA
MLWIGLYLPLLSLETVASLAPDEALVVVDAHRVVHANRSAAALGVRPGLKRATALALAPQLVLAQADPARDALALQAVAHAALAFTPMVCCDPPQTVLLEVQPSLRYFGGFARLLQRLRDLLQPLGHQVRLASAPTAQAAALLARLATADFCASGDGLLCTDLQASNRRLDAAPVALLADGPAQQEVLQSVGLRTIGELRRLPRSGVARRFGEALLHEIDRATGRRPDPRQPIVLAERFSGRLELLARADTTEQVLAGARMLLNRLVVWALAQQARVGRFRLQMLHERRHRSDIDTPPLSELEIALTEASCDVDHLQLLLRERLAQLKLAAPTLELQLLCDELVQRPPPNGELFPTARNEREGLVRLVERLQSRLGGDQVQRLVGIADHRPERASMLLPFDGQHGGSAMPRAVRSVEGQGATGAGLQQPVWLLAQAEPLAERERRPLLDGQPLQLLCGPERIEAGWWDQGLAERDYFIAQAADGSLVWIYRGRLPPRSLDEHDEVAVSANEQPGWFLHGRFA